MDRSQQKRPGIQTPSQINTNTFGNAQPVPRAISERISVRGLYVPDVNAPRINRASLIDINQPSKVHLPEPTVPNSTPQVHHQNNEAKYQEEIPVEPASIESNLSVVPAIHPPIDMSLPDETNFEKNYNSRNPFKNAKIKKNALKGSVVLIVIVFMSVGAFAAINYFKLQKVFKNGSNIVSALNPKVDPNLLKGEGSGRINILLLGRDGGNHKNPDITDSIMIASVDPVNNHAELISVPSDLWVNVPGAGVMKINAAWQAGEFKYEGKNIPGSIDPKAIASGYDLADQTVNQIFGINIDYNVIVNYQALTQAVDTVGGININVANDLVDQTMAWQNNNNPVLAKKGQQTFSGTTAQLYVSSKETSTDFARAQRQRDVTLAIENKILSISTITDPTKVSSLISTFGDNVATDLSMSNSARLYSMLKNISSNITSLDLLNGPKQFVNTGNISGQSIVLPTAGLFQYKDIQNYIRLQLKDPFILKENAKILILNGTTIPGVATSLANQLNPYGYNVIGEANAPTSDWKHTHLISLTKGNDFTHHYLEKRLNVSASNKLPDNSIPTNGADFVIIIGSDEAYNIQNQTN